ncbi:MAG: putative transport system ATP-binding protein [Solirubrobacteraceae bacterium]|jgi:putative ABC transport system ATP-binding protein|nr:putative transport system ATP-binding protein [Solirubrobacteraceae bacterium]
MTSSFSAELIRCRNVSVVHGTGPAQVSALLDIDLAVRPGERLALHGASGSGKTTLLHVLGGLLVPTRGVVSWQGEPLSTLDAAGRGRARAAGIAFVFQSSNLLPTFTAFENVAFAAAARSRTDDLDRRAIGPEELLGLVGLDGKLDALPAELSGGEAQRVALARALAQRPQLLLCDEPTGHLDSDTGIRVLDLIDALQAEFGFAQVTATHDADVVARYPRDLALRDGRVLAAEVSA